MNRWLVLGYVADSLKNGSQHSPPPGIHAVVKSPSIKYGLNLVTHFWQIVYRKSDGYHFLDKL